MLTESQLESLRYPVGRWQRPTVHDPRAVASGRAVLAAFPAALRAAVQSLPDALLDTPYRPEGWTVRQVVHHVADSHLNCLVRFKLALTEELPTIKPYMEDRWARLPDYRLPVEGSLRLLEAVHDRIDHVVGGMADQDWLREYLHPEYGQTFALYQVLSLYAWHCDHHMGHVRLVVK